MNLKFKKNSAVYEAMRLTFSPPSRANVRCWLESHDLVRVWAESPGVVLSTSEMAREGEWISFNTMTRQVEVWSDDGFRATFTPDVLAWDEGAMRLYFLSISPGLRLACKDLVRLGCIIQTPEGWRFGLVGQIVRNELFEQCAEEFKIMRCPDTTSYLCSIDKGHQGPHCFREHFHRYTYVRRP